MTLAAGTASALKLLKVPLDQTAERRLALSPRLVDPTGDLHPAWSPDWSSACTGAVAEVHGRVTGGADLLPRCYQPRPNQAQHKELQLAVLLG